MSHRPTQRPAISLSTLAEKRALGEPVVMVTAYDFPSAQVAEEAGVDVVLVGDSGAMTVLGYPSTVPVTLDGAAHARPGGAARAEDAADDRRHAVRVVRGLQRGGHPQRAEVREGGGLRRREDRARRHLRRAGARARGCRDPRHGPCGAHAADGHRARRLPLPGPDRRTGAGRAPRCARAPGGRLLRARLRGDPKRAHRGDHAAYGDPSDRHRGRRRPPTARCWCSTICSASTTATRRAS